MKLAAIVAGAVALFAAGLCLLLGNAGLRQQQSTPDAYALEGGRDPQRMVALLPQLRTHLDRHPRDARAWAILARFNFALDRFDEASLAYARALALPGKVAADATVWCEYADAFAMARGGRLAGFPRELIDKALTIDPRHPRALEMAGSAEIEQGNYAGALRYWEELLGILPPASPAHAELAAAVERARRHAGY